MSLLLGCHFVIGSYLAKRLECGSLLPLWKAKGA